MSDRVTHRDWTGPAPSERSESRGESKGLDVSSLPDYAFGDRSTMWWGTAGMIVIETSGFALLVMSYLYLRGRVPHWPPGVAPPALIWGTLSVVVMLLSAVPNAITKRAAHRLDSTAALWWLTIMIVFGVALCGIRALEFGALNVRWDTNAYGSIVWFLLGMHTAHLITDLGDSIVLLWFAARGPLDGPRFVDITENAIYWYFVVASWVPIYLLLYVVPRII